MIEFFKDSISVERRAYVQDANGEGEYIWAPHLDCKASVQFRSGNPVEIAGQVRFIKRGTAYTGIVDILSGDRVTFGPESYEVVHVYPISGSHQEVTLVEEGL